MFVVDADDGGAQMMKTRMMIVERSDDLAERLLALRAIRQICLMRTGSVSVNEEFLAKYTESGIFSYLLFCFVIFECLCVPVWVARIRVIFRNMA